MTLIEKQTEKMSRQVYEFLDKDDFDKVLEIISKQNGAVAQRYEEFAVKYFQVKNGPNNLAKKYREYEKLIPILMDCRYEVWALGKWAIDALIRLTESCNNNARKRWTKEEDELLVELAAGGDDLVAISLQMGRSAGAIQTRLTHLVGIGRVSQAVAGKFVGTLNGEYVQGYIKGDITKASV